MSEQDVEKFSKNELDLLREKNILEEFLDLSLREILVLFFIMRFPGEIVKNSLREEVNAYLHKDFSTSSFYNILDKLEKKKLIKIAGGKIVDVTDNAHEIIFELNRLTLICQINFVKMIEEIVPKVLMKSGMNREFKNTLLINLEFMIDVEVVNQLSMVTNNLFILTSPDEFRRYKARGLNERIQQSALSGNKIREANDFFDSILVVGYKGLGSYGENLNYLLKHELTRVLQNNGIIYLASSKSPEILENHFLANMIEKMLNQSDFVSVIKKETLYNDLESMNCKDLDHIQLNGMIIGWGVSHK